MKRFLQKSLFRLHSLLLLLVMSVVGINAAWAEQITETIVFSPTNYSGYEVTQGKIYVNAAWTDPYKGDHGTAGIYSRYDQSYGNLFVESDGGNIVKIEFEFANSDSNDAVTCSVGNMTSTGVWEGNAESVAFGSSDYTYYLSSIKVTYEVITISSPINYHIRMIDAPDGAEVTIDGQTFTKTNSDNGEYTYSKAELFKKKHFSHNEVNGFWTEETTFVADYENGECTYTVTYHPYYYYDVNIEGADGRGRINDSSDESVIESRTAMTADQFTASYVNGWTAGVIDYVAAVPPTHGSVSVTYTENAEHTYTVVFVNAPDGATVTVNNDKEIARDDVDNSYTTRLNLESYNFRASNVDGYDNEVELNDLIATVTYTEWPKYHVVVNGTTDANAGVIYDGTTYHNDEYIVRKWFYASNLKVVALPYYQGSIDYVEETKTINVTYTPVEYIEISANIGSWAYDPQITLGDVTLTGSYNTGSAFDICNGSSMTVSSQGAAITKIELIEQSNGTISSFYVNGQYATLSNNTWTASSPVNQAVFSSNSNNSIYVKAVRVWLVQPTTYTIAVVGAPAESNVSVSVDGIAGTYEDGGSFDTTDEIEAGDVTATLVDGYKAKVSIADNGEGKTITVTYVKVGAQIEFDFAQINKNSETIDDVTFTTNGYENGVVYLGLENNITFTSEDAKILIVEFEGERVSLIGSDPSGISNGVWEGASNSVVFTPTVPFNGPRLTKATVTLEALGDPTHYTVVFVPANDGASVTIDNNVLTPANSTFDSYKTLDETKVGNVVAPEGYYYDDDVAYNSENHTFTVTYTAYTKYSVAVAGDYTGDEAGVVVSGATYGNGTYSVGTDVISSKGDLEESKFTAKSVDGYDGAVSLNGYTVTVTYTAWPTWTVNITAPADYTGDALTATVKGTPYANGDTFKSKETVTDAQVSATSIPNYDASIVIDDNQHTITVTYVAYPTVAISNTDSEGKYWATFSFNHPVSFDAGVTPYIVTGAEDNKLTLEEIEILPAKKIKSFDFSNRKVDDILDNGRMFIEDYSGTNYYVNISYTGGTIAYNCFSGASTLNITSITLPIHQMIVTPGANGAKCSLNGGAAVEVSSEPYTFEVNAQSCTLAISGIGETTPQIACIDFIYAPTPVIPANTGVLLKAENAIANVNYSAHANADVNVDVTGNKLEASGNGVTMTEADPANLYYMLSLNAASDAGSLAFYWGTDSEQGHKISMPANKAYLKLPVSAGSSNRMLISGGYDETPTAIDGVVEVSDDAPIFTLQGKRVSRENLPAGVYVKNGRKFIVK